MIYLKELMTNGAKISTIGGFLVLTWENGHPYDTSIKTAVYNQRSDGEVQLFGTSTEIELMSYLYVNTNVDSYKVFNSTGEITVYPITVTGKTTQTLLFVSEGYEPVSLTFSTDDYLQRITEDVMFTTPYTPVTLTIDGVADGDSITISVIRDGITYITETLTPSDGIITYTHTYGSGFSYDISSDVYNTQTGLIDSDKTITLISGATSATGITVMCGGVTSSTSVDYKTLSNYSETISFPEQFVTVPMVTLTKLDATPQFYMTETYGKNKIRYHLITVTYSATNVTVNGFTLTTTFTKGGNLNSLPTGATAVDTYTVQREDSIRVQWDANA